MSEVDLDWVVYAGMKRLAKRPDLAPELRSAVEHAVFEYELELARDYEAEQASDNKTET